MVLTSWMVPGSSSSARMAFHSWPFCRARRTLVIRSNSRSLLRSPQNGVQLVQRLEDLVRGGTGLGGHLHGGQAWPHPLPADSRWRPNFLLWWPTCILHPDLRDSAATLDALTFSRSGLKPDGAIGRRRHSQLITRGFQSSEAPDPGVAAAANRERTESPARQALTPHAPRTLSFNGSASPRSVAEEALVGGDRDGGTFDLTPRAVPRNCQTHSQTWAMAWAGIASPNRRARQRG